MRKILWIMWLTLSCSQSSCRERKDRLISATESSFSSMLSDTELSDSDWLSPESTAVRINNYKLMLSCKYNGRVVLITKTLHCCSAWRRCFCPDANCFASARELKSAAKGFCEMFWLLLPWSVISLEHILHQQLCFYSLQGKKCVNYTQHLISQDQGSQITKSSMLIAKGFHYMKGTLYLTAKLFPFLLFW